MEVWRRGPSGRIVLGKRLSLEVNIEILPHFCLSFFHFLVSIRWTDPFALQPHGHGGCLTTGPKAMVPEWSPRHAPSVGQKMPFLLVGRFFSDICHSDRKLTNQSPSMPTTQLLSLLFSSHHQEEVHPATTLWFSKDTYPPVPSHGLTFLFTLILLRVPGQYLYILSFDKCLNTWSKYWTTNAHAKQFCQLQKRKFQSIARLQTPKLQDCIV